MSNSYFQFKQFRVEQAGCAMKITTDACIQGAWTPVGVQVKTVLDIGAGTGLLSLMLAQRSEAVSIDAVEYDSDAAVQAAHNFNASPWAARLRLIHTDVRDYAPADKFDLIITNPPFFINSLQGDVHARNLARHTIGLSYDDLINSITANLNNSGCASVLLPFTEYGIFRSKAAESGLFELSRLQVMHHPAAAVKRIVGLFSLAQPKHVAEETLIIKDQSGAYTSQFSALLAPYYLAL